MPSILEFHNQFEKLGGRAESGGDVVTAALCFQSAARMAATLKQDTHSANLMLKAGRLFMKSKDHLVTATYCYNEAVTRLGEKEACVAGSTCLELGQKFARNHDNSSALAWLRKAVAWFKRYPLHRAQALALIANVYIEMGNIEDALDACRTAVSEMKLVPMNTDDSKLLESLTWEESDHSLKDLSSDMAVLLPSVIMAVQSGDKRALLDLESHLVQHLKPHQMQLVHCIISQN